MANVKAWHSWADYALDTSGASTHLKHTLWCVVSALLGNIEGPSLGVGGAIPVGYRWTCMGSSDGTTGALDGVNRWLATYDVTKLVRHATPGQPHSWIALQSPNGLGLAGAAPVYLIFDYATSSDQTCNVYLCKTAPTGGSDTARPTSTDETTAMTNSFQDTNNWTANGGRCHFTINEDGEFLFLTSRNGATNSFRSAMGLHKLVNLRVPTDVWPWMFFFEADATGPVLTDMSVRFYNQGATVYGRGKKYDGIVQTQLSVCKVVGISGNSIATDMLNIFDYDSKYEAFPLTVYSATTGAKGLKGELQDFSVVPAAVSQGARYPTVGDVERILVGTTLVPLTVVPTLT